MPMEVEQNLNTIQQPYAQLPIVGPSNVAQVQYVPPVAPGPYVGQETYVPPQPMAPPPVVLPPSGCDACGVAIEEGCIVVPYRSGWTFGFDAAVLEPQITRGEFGSWPDESTGAGRLMLGYEDPEGIGLRGIVWGLSDEFRAASEDVELRMGTFHFDIYKSIVSNRGGELLLGFGSDYGSLEFGLPDENDRSRFSGGGGSVFAEGYYPFLRKPRWELGFAGQTRMSVLFGNWRDDTGSVIPPTNHDTMTTFEMSSGLEFRRRFGLCADHYWFARIMGEYQVWRSDWMSNFAGTSVGLVGTNFSFGLNW